MVKKKKRRLFSSSSSIILLIFASVFFSFALYYKQYIAIYLIHSIVILLVMLIGSLPFILKKYKKKQSLINICCIGLSVALIYGGFTIYNHNDRLASEGEYIGIDVSKWNNNINYQLVKQEVDFVIIRCGYTSLSDGTSTREDPLFNQNVQACLQHAIPYGIYYYSLAQDENQAKIEADFVAGLIQNLNPQLGIFIDLEDEEFQSDLSNEQLANIAITFLDNIPNQIPKGIYANHYWWTNKLTDLRLNNYIKWKARYNDNKTIDDGFQILQFSETGNVRGITGNVDLNLMSSIYW